MDEFHLTFYGVILVVALLGWEMLQDRFSKENGRGWGSYFVDCCCALYAQLIGRH